MNVNDGTVVCPTCFSGMHRSAVAEAHRANRAEARVAELEAFVRRCADGDHPDEIPDEAAALLSNGEGK